MMEQTTKKNEMCGYKHFYFFYSEAGAVVRFFESLSSRI